MLIFALSFIWRLIYAILSHLGRSWMDLISTLWVTIGSRCPYVLNDFFLGKESFRYFKGTYVFWHPLKCCSVCSFGGWFFPWCPLYRQATGQEFLPHSDIIFLLTSLLWIGLRIPFRMLSWVLVISQLVGKCKTLTCIKSCGYVGLSCHSSPQY